MPQIQEAAEFALYNATQLAQSQRAACYHCLTVFPADEVGDFREEEDGEATAYCPVCGVDAVLGDVTGYGFEEATLRALREYWFGELPDAVCYD